MSRVMNNIRKRSASLVFAFGNGVCVQVVIALAVLLCSFALAQADAPGTKQPDVLLIAIEDISPQRFGCYGNYLCKTPTIDQFAKEGLLFTNAHCSAAACSPSRTTLLTGLRPDDRNGISMKPLLLDPQRPNVVLIMTDDQ